MKSVNPENDIAFILKIFSIYYPLDVSYDESRVNIENVLNLAEKNNVLFFVSSQMLSRYFRLLDASQINRLKNIVKLGEETVKRLETTINFVNKICPECSYIKTYRVYPRIPSDLDVYSQKFKDRMRDFEKNNLVPKDYDKTLGEVAYFTDEVKIHLHGRIAWLNRKYFDEDLLTKNSKVAFFGNQEIRIPSSTMDLLIHLAHINFEPMHFTLSDMMYIFILSRNVDWNLAERQARKYHWQYAFSETLKHLNRYHRHFYSRNASFPVEYLHSKKDRTNYQYVLPKSLPRFQVIASFIGKGVILEPILKIRKVVKVLMSGNSYDGYYDPVEKKIDL